MILSANHCLRGAQSEKKNVSGICVILNLVFAVNFANFINHILKENIWHPEVLLVLKFMNETPG